MSWRRCANKKISTDGQTDGKTETGFTPVRKALHGLRPDNLKQPIQAESQEDRSFSADGQQVILNKANKKSKITKNRRTLTIRMSHSRNSLWIHLLPNVVAQLPYLPYPLPHFHQFSKYVITMIDVLDE